MKSHRTGFGFRDVCLLVLLLLLIIPAGALRAQTAYLVSDLTPGTNPEDAPSDPKSLFAAGGKVFFTARQESVGRELWELPAGSLDPGETAEAAAARECEEEITLVPGRIDRIREVLPAPGFCD